MRKLILGEVLPWLTMVGVLILMWSVSSWAESQIRHPARGHDNPYKQVLVTDKDGKEYWADVIADLESFSKEEDRSRLLRIIDNDARAAIYITQNDMGEMFTSMFIITSRDIDVNSPLFKRMGW